jgi:hypothetical protein
VHRAFAGILRIIRFIIIFSSRSENQPLEPLNQLAVDVGELGMSTKANKPAIRVIKPCMNVSRRFGESG